jgi:hypothetical protein
VVANNALASREAAVASLFALYYGELPATTFPELYSLACNYKSRFMGVGKRVGWGAKLAGPLAKASTLNGFLATGAKAGVRVRRATLVSVSKGRPNGR